MIGNRLDDKDSNSRLKIEMSCEFHKGTKGEIYEELSLYQIMHKVSLED